MGIKESFPLLIGETPTIKTNEERSFFNRTHNILKNNFSNNTYSDYNLVKSLETKSFVYGNKRPEKKDIRDYKWVEYLIIRINNLKEKYHAPWTNNLLQILKEKIINFPENKFFSDFFLSEYEINTIPKLINSENEKIYNDPNNNNYGDLLNSLFNTELPLIKDNNYCELDVLDNLGGSYLEINYDDLLPDDPTLLYQEKRIKVKKYIKIFKEHLYNNTDHPINEVISVFNKYFSQYINDKIKEYNDQLEKDILVQERYDLSIQNFEKEITDSLQEFISIMHSTLKLFYSTTIDLSFFEQEKDDLINLVTSFFFQNWKTL